MELSQNGVMARTKTQTSKLPNGLSVMYAEKGQEEKVYKLDGNILEDFFYESKSGNSLVRIENTNMIIVSKGIAAKIKKGTYTNVQAIYSGKLSPSVEQLANGKNQEFNTFRVDTNSLVSNSRASIVKQRLVEADEVSSILGEDGLEKLKAASEAYQASMDLIFAD